MAKMKLEFDGFNEAIARLNRLEGDVKKTTEQALIKSKRLVHKKIGTAMTKHNRTFQTIRSLDKSNHVAWTGTIASIEVGFDIQNGGLASVFLMYGTPRIKKDQQLYNSIYGKKTKSEIHDLQKEIFYEEIRKLT